MTALSKVSFCTAIHEEGSGFKNFIEGYLTTSKIRAVVAPPDAVETLGIQLGGSHLVAEIKNPDIECWETALKVASWILSAGILPLLALCIKIVMRCCDKSYKRIDPVELLRIGMQNGASPIQLREMSRDLGVDFSEGAASEGRDALAMADRLRATRIMAEGRFAR